jgi:hypothetical protein
MFGRNTNSNECYLSTGDSSGAMFIPDGSVWKLAGIHYPVDDPFSNEVNGTMFQAALMDRGGDQLRGRDSAEVFLATPTSASISTWSVLPEE